MERACILSFFLIAVVCAFAFEQAIPEWATSRDMFDVQFDYNIEAISGIANSSGAESDGQFLYTCCYLSNLFCKFELDGTFIESFSIDGVSCVRDLAYDGTYFYGSDTSNFIWEMDFDAHVLVSTITTPGPCRAIAYDEEADGFWINDWDSDMLLVNRNGQQVDLIVNPPSMYGAAYDSCSSGGPYLWFFTQPSTALCLIEQYTMDGVFTGVYCDPEDIFEESVAGGLFIQNNIIEGYSTIGGCLQGCTYRHLFGLELCEQPTPETVQGLTIVMSAQEGAVLAWRPVTQATNGTPLTPDGYLVMGSESSEPHSFHLLAATPDTTYTHQSVCQRHNKMFYYIVAYTDNDGEMACMLAELQDSLPDGLTLLQTEDRQVPEISQ